MTRASASSPVHQRTVRARMLQAYIGQEATDFNLLTRNYVNVNPQAADVRSLTVDAFVGGADYVFTFNGVQYTVTEDGTGALVADVATQIRAFMNATGAIYGVVTIAQVAGVLTLTGRLAGFTFTLTAAGDLTAALVTAAADAARVSFGRALVRSGFATGGNNSVDDAVERAALADTAALTAQVDTWTVADPGVGQFIGASLAIKGRDEIVSERVPWDTNLDTTLDNLAVVLNAALVDRGLNLYVTVAGPAGAPGAGQIAFTAAAAGVDFVSMVTSDDAAGYPAITLVTNRALGTSLPWNFAGVALRVSDEESTSATNVASITSYSPNATMLVMERGEVWVENSEALTYGAPVFVDRAAGEGRFYAAAAAGRIPLPLTRAEWVKSGRSIDGESLGLLRLK